MKVQILTLEAHDDRNSILDRLGWVQADRVVLVWPPQGLPLLTELDLTLVQRRARSRRIQLGLVADDPVLREAAASLKIPVFDSVEALSEREWRRRGLSPSLSLRRGPSPVSLREQRPAPARTGRLATLKGARAALFALPLLALLAALLAALPSALVVLHPALTAQRVEIEVLLAAEGLPAPGQRLVSAEWRSTRVVGDTRVPTTGTTREPAGLASGFVLLSNLTADPVQVPAGTGLRTVGPDSVRFVTTEPAALPGQLGASIEAPITATIPGSAGNVSAGEVSAVEGELGLQVAVTNLDATSGGSETARPAVSAADLRTAYTTLVAELQSQALTTLEDGLQPGEFVVEDSLHVAEEVQRTYDAETGDPADTLGLTLEVQIVGLVYREEALEQAALSALEEDAPHLVTVPGSMTLRILEGPATNRAGQTTLRLEAGRQAVASIDLAEAAGAIAGRPVDAASAWLSEAYDLRRPATMLLKPSFMPWLPFLAFRITVEPDWETAP